MIQGRQKRIHLFPGGQAPGAAFSLVELMVVVSIIAIFASLAIPRFRIFQARARQAEVKTNLAHIYTLQQAYHGDYDRYAELAKHGDGSCEPNELGFNLTPCDGSRYTYTAKVQGSSSFTATGSSGTGAENKVIPGCTVPGKLMIPLPHLHKSSRFQIGRHFPVLEK